MVVVHRKEAAPKTVLVGEDGVKSLRLQLGNPQVRMLRVEGPDVVFFVPFGDVADVEITKHTSK